MRTNRETARSLAPLTPRISVRWSLQLNESRYAYEEISSADYHTCAVTEDGELDCWGNALKAEQVPDGFQAA